MVIPEIDVEGLLLHRDATADDAAFVLCSDRRLSARLFPPLPLLLAAAVEYPAIRQTFNTIIYHNQT